MTTEERIQLRKHIEQAIEATQSKIDDLKELTKPIAPDVAIGRISRMDAINNKSINEAALRAAEDKMRKLEFANSRADDPKFGICTKCQTAINPARLALVPQSVFCIKCAQ